MHAQFTDTPATHSHTPLATSEHLTLSIKWRQVLILQVLQKRDQHLYNMTGASTGEYNTLMTKWPCCEGQQRIAWQHDSEVSAGEVIFRQLDYATMYIPVQASLSSGFCRNEIKKIIIVNIFLCTAQNTTHNIHSVYLLRITEWLPMNYMRAQYVAQTLECNVAMVIAYTLGL